MIMSDLLQDIRFAFRSFGRSPGFTAATIAVLGIGIGSVSLMFSTFNTVVLQPLPLENQEELVWLWIGNEDSPTNTVSYLDYADYRDGVSAFESLAAFMTFSPSAVITGGDEAERVITTFISHEFFSVLGVELEAGRAFLPEEELVGESQVAILSRGFWQQRFGGDPTIVGSTVTLNGQPVEVVGVVPTGFGFKNSVDIWLPLQQDAGYAQGRGNNNFLVVGRLNDNATLEQAQAQASGVARSIEEAYPDVKTGWFALLQPLSTVLLGSVRASLLVLLGIITLVPLVACANVGSLFLARATARRTELASRFALGADRARVVRQLLTESLLVGLAGGAVGLGIAYGGGQALRTFAPAVLPRLGSIGIDGNVMAFTLIASLLTVPLFGVLPALRGTDMRISDTLKAGGGRGASDRRGSFRSGLVVAQVALSLMLMIASGLFYRSFVSLQGVDPGFQAESVVTFQLQLPPFKYQTAEEIEVAWDEVYGRLLTVPDVQAVGSIDQLPAGGSGGTWNYVHAADRPPVTPADRLMGRRRFAMEGYFTAMRIPLLAGRLYESTDRGEAPPVVVINEAMAEMAFPGEDPLGKILVLPWTPAVNMEVIGVVADILEVGPGAPPVGTFYMAARQRPQTTMRFLVRTGGDPLDAIASIRRVVAEVDSDIPVAAVQTMEARLAGQLAQPRLRSLLVGIFALVALVLASIGIFGVLAYFVRQRAHELSVRLALGAGSGSVIGLVLRRGLALVGLGVLFGLAGGLAGAQLLQGAFFGVSPADPITFGGMSLCLVAVAVVACLLPAARAVRLDPASALKSE
jgi:putative ABC transport system permease protein